MDKVLEKFGIYDFLGIWGPGALTVTYYVLTMHDCFLSFLNWLGLSIGFLSQKYIFILLYTAVSYAVGVILHEVGKIVFGLFPFFHAGYIDKIMQKKMSDHPKLPHKIIQCECVKSINQNIPAFNANDIKFEEAISVLKYDNAINTRRVDTYHSVYALARSMFLCFFVHIFMYGIGVHLNGTAKISLFAVIIIDLALALLFYIRAYRYYWSWIKNVIIQYCYEKGIK